jgi:hypothetical protein
MAPPGPPPGSYSPQMQPPKYVQGYLDIESMPITHSFSERSNRNMMMDFTKGIASEVRILLAEIGKLRDERRQLQ